MISLQQRKLLTDIIDAIKSIDEHLESRREFNEYITTRLKEELLKRELEIIGETTGNLLQIDAGINLSYARMIVNLQNRVIHSYDNIDNTIIWKVIVKDLPVLLQEAQQLVLAP